MSANHAYREIRDELDAADNFRLTKANLQLEEQVQHLSQHKQLKNDSMTLRDYFALAALPVAWKAYESFGMDGDNANKEIAKASYQLADAMLKARESK